jgi:hypothetical protein
MSPAYKKCESSWRPHRGCTTIASTHDFAKQKKKNTVLIIANAKPFGQQKQEKGPRRNMLCLDVERKYKRLRAHYDT